MESDVTGGEMENDRLEEFNEEQEKGLGCRSGSEMTVDTVVMVVGDKRDKPEKRMKSIDYSSYCNSPTDLANTVIPQ